MKCGLEIHQRISDRKLFCDCDATIKEPVIIKKINRYLHPVTGESGRVDKAVMFEAGRSKGFTYEVTDKSSCLVETDSEPPHSVNLDALRTALSVARHLKMLIPDEIHVMRKTVIDGSNTTGFQRTMVIGLGTKHSYINTSEGKVRIKDLELEEESARIVSKDKGVYSLNALGTPLIEIGTYPDIKSPTQAYETALAIGELLRLTGRAQRGIGTIRQDVNISVRGGARVEIKGFQDLKNLGRLVEYEVMRQESLIKLKSELKSYEVKEVNLTNFFTNSDSRIVKGKKVLGLIITNFNGLLSRKLNPVKTLGSELADYARAQGVKGMIHTDEDLSKYGLEAEFITARRELGMNDDDLLLIIAGYGSEVSSAVSAVRSRIKLLSKQVPEETRIALKDCSSSYARPLPGGDRMYPETDVPLIKPLKDVPVIESKEERIKWLKGKGLTDELINKLVLNPRLDDFKELLKTGYDPLIIAKLLITFPREAKTRFNKIINPSLSDLKLIINYLNDGLITLKSVPEILSKGVDKINDYLLISDDELLKIINEVVKSNPGLTKKQLMGLIMRKVGSRVNGKRVMELIK